jgi:hypothetical protein
MMYEQEPVAIGILKKKMTCLLVVAPAPLKEQRCGNQLKSVSLAAVEQEEQQVCVLLNSSTTLCQDPKLQCSGSGICGFVNVN